uniref:Venom protein family 26 protein 1 n=1 Tax=Lethocerus distinctifemur TaxID=280095 RepID=A0A2K8JW37_9HEMI|nr:venom protein family 26 protein 1 [Lethocerus distinctifemur]
MLPTTIIIACLVGHFSSQVESYYIPFVHQGHQYDELEDQGYPYEAQYEFRAAPPVPPPAPLFSPHFGFPEPQPYPAPAQNPYNLFQQLPLPYQPFLRVPAVIRPSTPEIPVLIRLSDTRAILVPLKANYALPGLIERLVQRIQTYYSVFNPVESLTRPPLSPPASTPQPPAETSTPGEVVHTTDESTEKDNGEKATEATTAVEEQEGGETTEPTTATGDKRGEAAEATAAPEESTPGPADTATAAPASEEDAAPTTVETTTDLAEEQPTTATSETSEKPKTEN